MCQFLNLKFMKGYLLRETYKKIVDLFPVLCVDGLVINEKGEFLLVKRRNEPLKNRWWIPGGRIYKGETLTDGFLRKMKEEIGVDVKILLPLGYYEEHFRENPFNLKSGVHTLSVVFSCVPLSKKIKLDEQSSAFRWAKKLPKKLRNVKPFNAYV